MAAPPVPALPPVETAGIPVFLLLGPTASGKTDLLTSLFTGEGRFCPAEIISADSMQVYRGMDIGTAKPSPELRASLPHHLIDIRDPREQFNAGDFVRLADLAVQDIWGRGALPVISGGTGFYVKHFVQGLPEAPPSDPEIRRVLKEEMDWGGIDALADELTRSDPLSAGRIHPHDVYRLLRALEVFRLTGRPLSSYASQGSDSSGKAGNRHYRFFIASLERPRDEIYRRIDARCTAMFHSGLPGEVRSLYQRGYSPRDPGLRAIGYREFFWEEGEGEFHLSEDTAAVLDLVARNSRRYAKRQGAFFPSIPGLTRIPVDPGTVDRLRGELDRWLAGNTGSSASS